MQRDFLLRILEEWGALWRRVVRLNDINKYHESLQELDEAYGRLFGYNARFIDLLPDEDLLALGRQHGQVAADRCYVLGALLSTEGDQYAGLHMFEESYWRYERACLVFAQLLKAATAPDAEATALIEQTAHKLHQYTPSSIGGWALVEVYTGLGFYAQAEDVLYEWLSICTYDQAAIQRGITWYTQRMQLNDERLIAGDLEAQDVLEGLAQLIHIRLTPSKEGADDS